MNVRPDLHRGVVISVDSQELPRLMEILSSVSGDGSHVTWVDASWAKRLRDQLRDVQHDW